MIRVQLMSLCMCFIWKYIVKEFQSNKIQDQSVLNRITLFSVEICVV